MWVKCTVGSGWLLVTLSLAIASHKPSFITKNCYSWDSLSQAIDTLYVKAAQLKETVPEDSIKNVRLLKKNTKELFLTNCRFQEQLLSFFMDDVFGQLQFQAFNETDFVEDFHCFRQKLSRCYLMWTDNARRGIIRPRLDVLVRSHSRCGFCNHPDTFLMPKITCASSAREMKSITRMKRTFYGIGNKGIYKAIGELDILLSWIKKFLESIPEIKKPSIEI